MRVAAYVWVFLGVIVRVCASIVSAIEFSACVESGIRLNVKYGNAHLQLAVLVVTKNKQTAVAAAATE